MKHYNVTQERFLEITNSSETAQQAAERLGMPKAIFLSRASYYRSKGIHVKSFGKPRAGRVEPRAFVTSSNIGHVRGPQGFTLPKGETYIKNEEMVRFYIRSVVERVAEKRSGR